MYPDALGYFAVCLVLFAYIKGGQYYDWMNVITAPILAMVAGYHHAWPNMGLALAFGCIAVFRLWRYS